MTREVVQLVELVQPYCANTFGASPCVAIGEKCFNTRATCRDHENFALQSGGLPLFFSRGNVADRGIDGVPYIIPSLVSVSTTPTRINLAAANTSATGLGNRAVCTVTFRDHPHTDRVVDPYLSDRTYDPMTKGSFWSKWMVRNKYRYNMLINVYEGYAGETLAQMQKRTYFLTEASGPNESGGVTLKGKDILAKVEERKATAPEASNGSLLSDITDTDTTFEVVGVTTADYPASGTIRVNDELMTYSGTVDGDTGIVFAITARGTDGTTADEHDAEDAVQECVRYTDQTVDAIVTDLLTTWAGVDASYIDTTSFTSEVNNYLESYILSTVLSEPVSVASLLSELQQQCGFYVWWDEKQAKILFKAVRGVNSSPDVLTDGANFIGDSFALYDLPRSRISQVWFYYDQRNPVDDEEKSVNFRQVQVQADLPSESEEQFGEKSVRKIYSRWISEGSLALSTTSKIIVRYRDVPRECKFRMDAKDRSYGVGDAIGISHFLDVDQFGDRQVSTWTIISQKDVLPGEVVEFVAQDTTLYGVISVIQADSAPDYTAGDSRFLFWIGDADGLLSDGTECSRVT